MKFYFFIQARIEIAASTQVVTPRKKNAKAWIKSIRGKKLKGKENEKEKKKIMTRDPN